MLACQETSEMERQDYEAMETERYTEYKWMGRKAGERTASNQDKQEALRSTLEAMLIGLSTVQLNMHVYFIHNLVETEFWLWWY